MCIYCQNVYILIVDTHCVHQMSRYGVVPYITNISRYIPVNESIGGFSMKRFLNPAKLTALFAALLVGALAIGCGDNGGSTTTLVGVAISGDGVGTAVAGEQYNLTLIVGDNVTLTAAPVPGNARVTEWEWASSAGTVASITGTGYTREVSGAAVGTAEITVTATGPGGTHTTTINVTVSPLPPLSTPGNLVFARQGMNLLDPLDGERRTVTGLSWAPVTGSVGYNILVFTTENETNLANALPHVGNVDSPAFNPLTGFTALQLPDGPYWFRIQAVGDNVDNSSSALSVPMGPFWHNTERTILAPTPVTPEGRVEAVAFARERLENENIPVIVIDVRRADERYVTEHSPANPTTYGRIVDDFFVTWANNELAFTRDGATDATFQAGVLAAWEEVKANLTPAQRATLTPALNYRDIYVFVYCAGGVRTVPGTAAIATLGFTRVYDIGGFTGGTNLRGAGGLPEELLDLTRVER